MENDPSTPQLVSSTRTMEADLVEASVNTSSDEESFVLAEPSMPAETGDCMNSSVMTQSKYAQVVFMEICDRYPNDCDILCKFAYNIEIPTANAMTSDRIGLYRVPDFAPHEYLTFRWVSEASKLDKNCLSLNFAGKDLPKEEDYYQFQFLRTENGTESAIGASVPFQLTSPKTEELCTVEDDEEFMVVRSRTSLVTEQMSMLSSDNTNLKDKLADLEGKHKSLLVLSEEMKQDLDGKTLELAQKHSQLEAFKEDKEKMEQLKADLAVVLQDKCLLEDKLHRHIKALKTLQMDRDLIASERDHAASALKPLQMDRDLLAGERDQAVREKELLNEERRQILAKNEEMKNMLHASSKAKDLAVAEVRTIMLKSDEQQRQIKYLDELNRDLLQVNKEQKEMLDQCRLNKDDFGSLKTQIAELEMAKNAEIAELQAKLTELEEAKSLEIEALTSKLQRNEREFQHLKQELCERSKSKFREIDNLKLQLRQAERNLNKLEITPVQSINVTEEVEEEPPTEEDQSLFSKLSEIEKCVKRTEKELQAFIVGSNANSSLATSNPPSSIATEDSTRLLDDQVIASALAAPEAEAEEEGASMTLPLKKRINEMMEGFKEMEDSPKITTPIHEKPQSKSSIFQLLPQLVQSVSEHLTTPSAPPIAGSNDPTDDDFAELVNWQKANISSQNDNIVLMDDGRTLTQDEAKPKCPVCEETFEPGQVAELQHHVDAHLVTDLYCPVCDGHFNVSQRTEYQEHVQNHFRNEDGAEAGSASASSWFLDFD